MRNMFQRWMCEQIIICYAAFLYMQNLEDGKDDLGDELFDFVGMLADWWQQDQLRIVTDMIPIPVFAGDDVDSVIARYEARVSESKQSVDPDNQIANHDEGVARINRDKANGTLDESGEEFQF